ncbi:MAG: bifunctional folylpolyglutamate synthase/dihydrofolate synthase [Terriglobales bacterium]
MNPAQTLQFLHGLGLELRPGRKFELGTITRVLAELGNPQRAWPSVHVAGTNGKGSTCALIESAARAAGLRTGLYTSPHLQRLTERIRIAGDEISPEALAAVATTVRDAIERLLAAGVFPHPPAFFEVVTAAGFVAFAQAGIELGVIEVGLGGRLDATNVLAPRVAIITAIGMDHELYLGSTLVAIAGEKAGIIKSGLDLAISAPQAPEVAEVLRTRARQVGVRLEEISDAEIASAPATILRGAHQRMNAAVAARACAALGISGAAVRDGFASAFWPGRLERIATNPDVYLDGAHNPLAARALAAYLDENCDSHPAPILIYGTMRDKAIEEICELLFPRAQAVVLTAPGQSRALAPEALARTAGAWARRFEIAADYPAALERALQLARASDPAAPVFVTGSLYLVGEARAHAFPSV